MDYLLVALLAYLIGAVPTAYLIVRLLTGRDIRALGSGNVGVMNTVRQAGLPAGMLAFLSEGAKGIGAISVARALAGTPQAEGIAAIMALVGVNWSVFMGFRGGRGTTVTVFVAIVLLWPLVVIMGLLWLAVYQLRHDNFIATRVNIIAAPFVTAVLVLALDKSLVYIWFIALGSLVSLLRQRRETDDHYITATARVSTE